MTDIPIKIQFVKSLSTAQPSRIVAVKADGDTNFTLYVTDKNGLPFPLKETSSGIVTAIQNTDGKLVITGSDTKTINVAPALLSLINSALQAGDNVSELVNDASYITLADIPTFVASDYDLEDFTNAGVDPYAHLSDLSTGITNLDYIPSPTQGIVTSDTGSDATIPLADGTNAGLLSSAEKAEIATALQPSDITGLVPYTGATTNVDLGEHQLKTGQLELDQTPTGAFSTAKIRWNDTAGTAEMRLKGNSVTLQLGQELVKRVVNKTATNITLQESNYQVVRIIGATGQRLSVDLAQADSEANSASTLGLVTENIANNQEGFITFSGEINLINTTGSLQGETWVDGDVLYLSPTIAGQLTNIEPIAPDRKIRVGYVQHTHATQGKIHVDVDRGYSLENLHNVKITATTAGKILGSTTEGLWENKTIPDALGFTPENIANKQNSLAIDGTGVKYPTVDAVNTLKDYSKEITVGTGGTYSTLELLFLNESSGKTLINLIDAEYNCTNPQFVVKTGWIIKGKGYGKTNINFNFTTPINPDLSGLQIRNECRLEDFKVTSINNTNLGGYSQYALHSDYVGAFTAKITRCCFKTVANPNVIDANGYNGLSVGIGTWEGQNIEFHESILQSQAVAIDNKYTLNLHNTYVNTLHSTPSRVSFYNSQLTGGFTTVLISDTYSNSSESDSSRIKDLFEFVGCEIKGGIYLRTANQLGGTDRKNGLAFNFSGTNVDEFINVGEIVDTSLSNYDVTSLPLTKDVDFQKNLGTVIINEGDFVSYVYANRIPEYHTVSETSTIIGIEKLNTSNIKKFAGLSLTNTLVGDFAHVNTGAISYTASTYPNINIGDLVAFNSDDATPVKSFFNGIGKVYKKTDTGRLGIFISKGSKTENSIGTYTERGVLEVKGNSGGAGHPTIWLEDSNIIGEVTNYAISAGTNTHDLPFYEKGRFSINDNVEEEERFAIDYRGLNIIRRKLSVLDSYSAGDTSDYSKLPTIDVKGNNRLIGASPLDFGNIQINSREAQDENIGGSIGLGGVYNSTGGIVSFAKIHGKKETSVTGSFDGYLAFEVSNNTTVPYSREVGRFGSSGDFSVLRNITATSYTGSATLTGTPTAPTAPAGTNTTQIATTAFVKTEISNNTVSRVIAPDVVIANGATTAIITLASNASYLGHITYLSDKTRFKSIIFGVGQEGGSVQGAINVINDPAGSQFSVSIVGGVVSVTNASGASQTFKIVLSKIGF